VSGLANDFGPVTLKRFYGATGYNRTQSDPFGVISNKSELSPRAERQGWRRRRESNPRPGSSEKSDGARLPLPGLDSRPNVLPLRVPWSPLQSPGVPPSPGDMLETALTRGVLFR